MGDLGLVRACVGARVMGRGVWSGVFFDWLLLGIIICIYSLHLAIIICIFCLDTANCTYPCSYYPQKPTNFPSSTPSESVLGESSPWPSRRSRLLKSLPKPITNLPPLDPPLPNPHTLPPLRLIPLSNTKPLQLLHHSLHLNL